MRNLGMFDHRITEARPAILDSEQFWKFHAWLPQTEVEKLNERIANGEARQIYPVQELQAAALIRIITFGAGHEYDVEAITRCAVCGVQISFQETAEELATCHTDKWQAYDELKHGRGI